MPVIITEALLSGLKKGDDGAYTIIFNEYFNRLCHFASTYVADESIAKNIVQDVFIKLWEKRQSLRENTSIFSFLITITKNNCLDYLKHKQIEIKFKNEEVFHQKEVDYNYYALKRLDVELMDFNEILEIVEKTLSTLPPQCQQVFRLSRFDSLSNGEIAEKLNIGQKAVEANITRAIKIFRKELKDYITILLLFKIPF